MKNRIIILLSLVMLCLVSCGKDNKQSSTPAPVKSDTMQKTDNEFQRFKFQLLNDSSLKAAQGGPSSTPVMRDQEQYIFKTINMNLNEKDAWDLALNLQKEASENAPQKAADEKGGLLNTIKKGFSTLKGKVQNTSPALAKDEGTIATIHEKQGDKIIHSFCAEGQPCNEKVVRSALAEMVDKSNEYRRLGNNIYGVLTEKNIWVIDLNAPILANPILQIDLNNSAVTYLSSSDTGNIKATSM